MGLAAGALAWSLIEAAAYQVRRVDVPVLPAGVAPLRVLHLSDLHLAPWQRRKREWLRGLAALEPDMTVVTGDFMGDMGAVPVVLDALDGLLHRPGAFVLGTNDYFAPKPRNPLRYLTGPSSDDRLNGVQRLPTGDLVSGLTERGWVYLDNSRDHVSVGGVVIDLVGVDDPHHGFDQMPEPADRIDRAALRLGIAHAPYRRVLDAMTADGAELIVSGHTHGGQVCVPGWGALVTNCDLPQRYAKGLFAWSPPVPPDGDALAEPTRSWVHVSAGVGTSPFTPIRVACPPEVTLLRLTAR